jgi:hypothetical protein
MGIVVMLTFDLELCGPRALDARSGSEFGTASTAAASDVEAEDMGV